VLLGLSRIGVIEEDVMKIFLDQRNCNCWDAACETHFGWHFLREEVTPVDCTVEVVDDGQSEITFLIKDRDGSDKVLVVDEKNWADAYESWRQAWEVQQSKVS
jgi:hypothetical protein